jgi:hypothetical protein
MIYSCPILRSTSYSFGESLTLGFEQQTWTLAFFECFIMQGKLLFQSQYMKASRTNNNTP